MSKPWPAPDKHAAPGNRSSTPIGGKNIEAQANPRPDAKTELLEAAKRVLLEHGYSGLSTRAVAAAAGTQMSQIRYHFGSKEGMVLALFDYMNANLIDRQADAFERSDLSVAEKWALSCDYLEADINLGYVRVLQELIAVGWTNPAVGDVVREALSQWHQLIEKRAREIERDLGTLGPFSPEQIASLVSAMFIGAEALILLQFEDSAHPIRSALRRVGEAIERLEQAKKD